MPPAISPLPTCALRIRPRGARTLLRPGIVAIRKVTENNDPNKLPEAAAGERGPNTQQQEHVSEEAAKMAKIQGGGGPDLDQGTPVQDVREKLLVNSAFGG